MVLNPQTPSIDQKEELTAQVRPYSDTDINEKSRSISTEDARPKKNSKQTSSGKGTSRPGLADINKRFVAVTNGLRAP
jgi:hypothetical protein